MITAAAAVIVTLGLSAFSPDASRASRDELTFEYTESTQTEALLQQATSWREADEETACSGEDIVCTASISEDELSGYNEPTLEARFAHFLADQTPASTGATDFINEHTVAQKAEETQDR